MSRASAALFRRLQQMPFYVEAHRAAVDLVPAQGPSRWVDVGTGPGLVSRLAAQRGHHVTGLDPDPMMIRAARAADPHGTADYVVGSLADLPTVPRRARADVVSATSLLAVVADPGKTLTSLWSAVADTGWLLVVETTSRMRPGAAREIPGLGAAERLMLDLWARARSNRAVDVRLFASVPAAQVTRTPVLGGLLHAWLLTKGVLE